MIYDRPIWALMQDAAADLSPPYTVGELIAWFAQHYPKIKATSVRAHIKGLTVNDPSRHHYQVSGRAALFVRQLDKTLMPYDVTADSDTDDDEELDDEPVLTDEVTLELILGIRPGGSPRGVPRRQLEVDRLGTATGDLERPSWRIRTSARDTCRPTGLPVLRPSDRCAHRRRAQARAAIG